MKLIKKKHILFLSLFGLAAFFSQCAKESEEILDFLGNANNKSFSYGGTKYITDQSLLASSTVPTGEFEYDTTFKIKSVTEEDYTEDKCKELVDPEWVPYPTSTSRTSGFVQPLGSCTHTCPTCDTIITPSPILTTSASLFITNSADINTEAEDLDGLSDGEYTLKLSFLDVEGTDEFAIRNTTIEYPDTSGARSFSILIKDENLEMTSARGHVVIDSITSTFARLSYNIIIDEETETRIIGKYVGPVNDVE